MAEATAAMRQMAVAQTNDTFVQREINFNDVPLWQRRGPGAYFANVDLKGYHPHHQVDTTSQRRRLKVDEELPMKDRYTAFLQCLLTAAVTTDE